MKKLALIVIVIGGLLSHQASAQVNVSINIGSQPLWGATVYGQA
jgi:hypothetical protein